MTSAFSSFGNEVAPTATEEKIKTPMESVSESLKSDDPKTLIEGLKTLLALISREEVCSDAIPGVMIALGNKDEEVRHLASIVCAVVKGVDDLLLLSFGSFFKLAHDIEPSVRAISVKTFTSFNFPEVNAMTLETLNELSNDMSPLVRRSVAIACVKVVNEENREEILSKLKRFLSDQSPIVISAAVYALSIICPDDDSVMHPHFRSLCNELSRLDPWGQAFTLRAMTRYAMRNFRKPEDIDTDDWETMGDEIDPDLDLLLTSAQPLLSSITPCVAMNAAILFFYCAPPLKRNMFVKPMIRLACDEGAVQYSALAVIEAMVADDPEPFLPHIRQFFAYDEEPRDVKMIKFRVLSRLARPMNSREIMDELYQQATTRDKELSNEAIMAIGRAASLSGKLTYNSFTHLMRLLYSPLTYVVSSAVHVICILLSPLPQEEEKSGKEDPLFGDLSELSMDESEVISVLKKVITFFGKIDDPEAKSALISIIGAKAKIIPLHAHEVLRQLSITFPQQVRSVKLQTITLAARVYFIRPAESKDLVKFVFSQGMYDVDIDIRDRVRLCHTLMTVATKQTTILSLRKRAEEFLFPEKPAVIWDNDSQKASVVDIGTFSQVLGNLDAPRAVQWAKPEDLPPASVRDNAAEDDIQIPIEVEEGYVLDKEEEDFESFFGGKEETTEMKPSNNFNDDDVIDDDFFN